MKYQNITPPDYVERKFCEEIFYHLDEYYNDDILLLVRAWDQTPPFPSQRYISIVTSAEGHTYIPEEKDDPNCMGVFMHYPPKTSLKHQFSTDDFLTPNNVYPLQLGETKFFKGHPRIPINQRPIDVSFVGQFDPYRRADFYEVIKDGMADTIDNSVFHFYQGWNNGIGDRYSDIMTNTKVALVPCGSASLDTFRFYEAAKAGCIIICPPQNNYDFMEDAPYIPIPSWGILKHILEIVLRDEKLLYRRSLKTRNFWEEHLSPEAASFYIQEKLCTELT